MVSTPMELSPSSKLSFFDEAGTAIPLPIEGSTCGIAIDVPQESWSTISLHLGTDSLEVFFDEKEKRAHAMWPLCGPGQYELYLVCRDYRERRKITLMPRYFTESEFNSMMKELTEILPTSIALQLIECGGQLGKLDLKPSVEDEYLALRRILFGTPEKMGLLQILPVIQRECNHVLIPRLELRNSNQLRRPDISRLPAVMSIPGNVVSSDFVLQMYDMTVEPSFDTSENRLVKAYVQALRGRLSRLQARTEQASAALIGDIEALINEFNLACARATFLRDVKLPTVFTGRVTMVLLKNPVYRFVFEDYLALNQESSVTLEEAALGDPLNKFPFLYELWANLSVLNAMLQVCVESGFRCVSHNWVKRYNNGIFIQIVNDERAAIELECPKTGRKATLVSWKPDGGNEVLADTPNHERLIALAIVIESPQEQSVLLVFDPEYRVAAKASGLAGNAQMGIEESRSNIEPMKEDVADLIRWVDQSRASDSVRKIPYAAMLYPGPRMRFSPEVEALSAVPTDGGGLQKAVCDVLRQYLAVSAEGPL